MYTHVQAQYTHTHGGEVGGEFLTEILKRQEGIGYVSLFNANKTLESWKLLRRQNLTFEKTAY